MKVNEEKRRYWEERITAWLSSGLTQRAFCEREQLNRPTFDYWRRRIKPETAPSQQQARKAVPPATLIPVRVVPMIEAAPLIMHSPSGWRLNVPLTVDTDWLTRLMKALA